jgi:hypothetical protein
MAARPPQHRKPKGRANARPLRKIKTLEVTDEIDEEITESLIETFPASDPPAWVALARVGNPKRQTTSRRARRAKHR